MNIIVTGARGFVGMNVAQRFAAEGATVWAVDRSPIDDWISAFFADHESSINHVTADLSQHSDLKDALPLSSVDAVIHAAVVTATTTEVERNDARDIVDSNVGGTIETLNVAVGLGAKRFIYVSSPSAIGSVEVTGAVKESVIPKPNSLYGITKLASEQIVERWAQLHDLETASVRIAQPYGPGERATSARVRTSPIWEWLRDAQPGETLPTGPLDRERDWTYVEDTAEGIARLALADRLPHRLYHLGTGVQVRVGDVLDILGRHVDDLHFDREPAADALNPNTSGPGRPPLDVSRFDSDFGWKPTTSIQDGMNRYIQWWDEFSRIVGSTSRR